MFNNNNNLFMLNTVDSIEFYQRCETTSIIHSRSRKLFIFLYLISGVHVEGVDGAGREIHRPGRLVHRAPVQLLQIGLDGKLVEPNLHSRQNRYHFMQCSSSTLRT